MKGSLYALGTVMVALAVLLSGAGDVLAGLMYNCCYKKSVEFPGGKTETHQTEGDGECTVLRAWVQAGPVFANCHTQAPAVCPECGVEYTDQPCGKMQMYCERADHSNAACTDYHGGQASYCHGNKCPECAWKRAASHS